MLVYACSSFNVELYSMVILNDVFVMLGGPVKMLSFRVMFAG